MNHLVGNRKFGLIAVLFLALFLQACAKKKEAPVVVDDTTQQAPAVDPNADPYGLGYSKDYLMSLGIDGNPLDETVVLFEYNSSAIDERSTVIVTAHARHLGKNGGARVTLEGHADERGTRDYNLALGERRAQAVAQLMNAQGAQSSIQTISYGEERPVDPGHTEAAWKQNRRVEIKY